MIGMVSVARPDEDGTRNDIRIWMPNIALMNTISDRPVTMPSADFRIVSVILPASMTTTTPRATPMISATPSRSRAPSTKVSTNVCSSMREASSNRPTSQTTMAMSRNRADISPIHHSRKTTP